jgi:hypothetical protein
MSKKCDINIKRPGLLHEKMGVPKGEKIPVKALKAEKSEAKKTGDKKLMKETTFALNFGKGKK